MNITNMNDAFNVNYNITVVLLDIRTGHEQGKNL